MLWFSIFICGTINTQPISPGNFRTFALMETIEMDVPESLRSVTESELNTRCVDCGAADTEWASLGFGTLICLKCAGFHRSLGTHITSVRAVKLDSWSPEQVKLLKVGGNSAFQRHCGISNITPEEFMSMTKYGNPKVLHYSAIVKARAEERAEPEYTESEWTSTAAYAQQAAANFVNNVQETGLNNASEPSSAKKSPTRPDNWVPDNAASKCMECTSSFTLLFRRHHCRRCGRTVCGTCAPANNNRPIPEWGYSDPVRHCKACYKSPAVEWK